MEVAPVFRSYPSTGRACGRAKTSGSPVRPEGGPAKSADEYPSAVLSPAVENLVLQLTKLPGIGRRSAQRLTFHLLSARPEDALELARAIEEVKARVRFCRECWNLTEDELCEA